MTRLVLFALNRFKIKYNHFLNVSDDGILCSCLGSINQSTLIIGGGRYTSCRQMKRANKQQKSLKTYLGRVVRDIERKVAGREMLQRVFPEPLSLARRILNQKRQDKNKVYSIHAPEV